MKQLSTPLFLIMLALSFFITGCNRSTFNNYMIVGYVAGYREYDFSTIDVTMMTHINYAFANIIDGKVIFESDSIDNNEMNSSDIITLAGLKKNNPDLKVLVSVGGWGWSGNFSDAALTDSSRNRFASSAAEFIAKYKLDGIDIDWEYPNQTGAGNVFRPADVHNFTLMLSCLREHLDSLADEQFRTERYLLTIATGGDSVYAANTELGKISEYVDFINIMTYDFHHGLSWQTGHHSNLYLSDYDSRNGDATERSVRMHIEAGVPPEKINIGIPFYGRKWNGVEPVNNGLYRQAKTTGAGIPYTEVLVAASDSNYIRYYDSTAAAPYLWNDKDSVFISYDDETSLKEKMQFVKTKKLGGVMFWEYTEDVDGRLLKTIANELKDQQ